MKKILVLCTGNACRSQMAEGYLRFFIQGQVEVISAGLEPTHLHPLAVQVMLEDNIDISEAESKGLEQFSGEHFDYLLTVCKNAKDRQPADVTAEQYFHFDISDPEEGAKEVADPNVAFTDTREQIKREMLQFIGKQDDLHQPSVSDTASAFPE